MFTVRLLLVQKKFHTLRQTNTITISKTNIIEWWRIEIGIRCTIKMYWRSLAFPVSLTKFQRIRWNLDQSKENGGGIGTFFNGWFEHRGDEGFQGFTGVFGEEEGIGELNRYHFGCISVREWESTKEQSVKHDSHGHISAFIGLYSNPWMTSGAAYGRVPQNSWDSATMSENLANPKSASLADPLDNKMFSNLMSEWATWFLWQ